jgi:hypothetical protein
MPSGTATRITEEAASLPTPIAMGAKSPAETAITANQNDTAPWCSRSLAERAYAQVEALPRHGAGRCHVTVRGAGEVWFGAAMYQEGSGPLFSHMHMITPGIAASLTPPSVQRPQRAEQVASVDEAARVAVQRRRLRAPRLHLPALHLPHRHA